MKIRERDLVANFGSYGWRNYAAYGGSLWTKYFPKSGSALFDPTNKYSHIYSRGRATTIASSIDTLGRERLETAYPSSFPKFNPCKHDKSEIICLPFSVYSYGGRTLDTLGELWTFQGYSRQQGYSTLQQNQTLQHFNPFPSDVRRRAWHTIQPRFEGEVSMLNFLFELKDFKQLAKFLLRPNYGAIRRTLSRLKDPTRLLSEGWLTWQLALKPLLSDLSAIHAQAQLVVREVQEQFQLAGEDVQKTHYSESWPSLEITSSPRAYIKAGTLIDERFTATMRYTYEYRMRSTVDAFMHYWGLTMNAETFWNAIPFSFIVDYFIKIGDSLRAMRRDKNISLSVSEYCESMYTLKHIGFWYEPSDVSRLLVLDEQQVNAEHRHPLTGHKVSLYTRRVTKPLKGLYVPRIKAPSIKQKATMVALVRCML